MMKRLTGFLLFPFMMFVWSCSTEGDIRKVLGTHAEVPVFLDCRPVSSTEIVFTFSRSVRVVSLNFEPLLEAGPIEEGQEIRINLTFELQVLQK